MAKYGIISDMHRIDPKFVYLAIDILKNQGIDALVLNGDLVGDQFSELNNKQYFGNLLEYLGSKKIETYILPGSHEIVREVEGIAKDFQKNFPNFVYTIDNPIIDKKDHQLVFLPGSDWRPGNALEEGYSLMSGPYESGIYLNENKDPIRLINMDDLKKYVKEPDKTILFSHIPGKFSNSNVAVDMAEFGEVQNDFYLNGQRIEKGSVFVYNIATQLVNIGCPIELKKENRGNQELSDIIKKLGIKKHITGHFHESVHRAHNLKEEPIKEGEWSNELFFMASYMDAFKFGLLEVKEDKVRYYKLDLNNLRR